MDRGLAASAALGEYFGAILADRRKSPADDLMSTLAQAELDGQHLTDDEIFAFLRLLLPAGAETTFRSSAATCCSACSTIPRSSTRCATTAR